MLFDILESEFRKQKLVKLGTIAVLRAVNQTHKLIKQALIDTEDSDLERLANLISVIDDDTIFDKLESDIDQLQSNVADTVTRIQAVLGVVKDDELAKLAADYLNSIRSTLQLVQPDNEQLYPELAYLSKRLISLHTILATAYTIGSDILVSNRPLSLLIDNLRAGYRYLSDYRLTIENSAREIDKLRQLILNAEKNIYNRIPEFEQLSEQYDSLKHVADGLINDSRESIFAKVKQIIDTLEQRAKQNNQSDSDYLVSLLTDNYKQILSRLANKLNTLTKLELIYTPITSSSADTDTDNRFVGRSGYELLANLSALSAGLTRYERLLNQLTRYEILFSLAESFHNVQHESDLQIDLDDKAREIDLDQLISITADLIRLKPANQNQQSLTDQTSNPNLLASVYSRLLQLFDRHLMLADTIDRVFGCLGFTGNRLSSESAANIEQLRAISYQIRSYLATLITIREQLQSAARGISNLDANRTRLIELNGISYTVSIDISIWIQVLQLLEFSFASILYRLNRLLSAVSLIDYLYTIWYQLIPNDTISAASIFASAISFSLQIIDNLTHPERYRSIFESLQTITTIREANETTYQQLFDKIGLLAKSYLKQAVTKLSMNIDNLQKLIEYEIGYDYYQLESDRTLRAYQYIQQANPISDTENLIISYERTKSFVESVDTEYQRVSSSTTASVIDKHKLNTIDGILQALSDRLKNVKELLAKLEALYQTTCTDNISCLYDNLDEQRLLTDITSIINQPYQLYLLLLIEHPDNLKQYLLQLAKSDLSAEDYQSVESKLNDTAILDTIISTLRAQLTIQSESLKPLIEYSINLIRYYNLSNEIDRLQSEIQTKLSGISELRDRLYQLIPNDKTLIDWLANPEQQLTALRAQLTSLTNIISAITRFNSIASSGCISWYNSYQLTFELLDSRYSLLDSTADGIQQTLDTYLSDGYTKLASCWIDIQQLRSQFMCNNVQLKQILTNNILNTLESIKTDLEEQLAQSALTDQTQTAVQAITSLIDQIESDGWLGIDRIWLLAKSSSAFQLQLIARWFDLYRSGYWYRLASTSRANTTTIHTALDSLVTVFDLLQSNRYEQLIDATIRQLLDYLVYESLETVDSINGNSDSADIVNQFNSASNTISTLLFNRNLSASEIESIARDLDQQIDSILSATDIDMQTKQLYRFLLVVFNGLDLLAKLTEQLSTIRLSTNDYQLNTIPEFELYALLEQLLLIRVELSDSRAQLNTAYPLFKSLLSENREQHISNWIQLTRTLLALANNIEFAS